LFTVTRVEPTAPQLVLRERERVRVRLPFTRVEQIFGEAARHVEQHHVLERLRELLDARFEHLERAVQDPRIPLEHARAGLAQQLDRDGAG
jgi:hypothetical protein